MSKSWAELRPESIARLSAQLGVYEIASTEGTIAKIGYAGGRQPFGMRSALAGELEAAGGEARLFRFEFTHGYLTRWQELLMLHQADHGELPPGNADRVGRIGRLSPGGVS
jgi:hypothetical protein